jgi:hypothetical protein
MLNAIAVNKDFTVMVTSVIKVTDFDEENCHIKFLSTHVTYRKCGLLQNCVKGRFLFVQNTNTGSIHLDMFQRFSQNLITMKAKNVTVIVSQDRGHCISVFRFAMLQILVFLISGLKK